MELDQTERRVLGSMLEKRWTTPDAYPLSLNALVSACNQKSNRDPVLKLEEFEITGCLLTLRQRGLVMQHESYTGRVPRYGERLVEQLAVDREEGAVLAELMNRGPQTAPELARRCSRMTPIKGADQAGDVLRGLAEKRLARVLPRGSGQRHARWEHLLSLADESAPSVVETSEPAPGPAAPTPAPAPAPAVATPSPSMADELAALRREVEDLRARIETLEGLV